MYKTRATPGQIALDLVKPLADLYRVGEVKPGAIMVTPEQFDALVDVVGVHADLLAALEAHDEWYDLVKQNYPEMLRPYELGRAALSRARGLQPDNQPKTGKANENE